ncbi:MAG: FAD-dependent oxidoreductase [Candidatus Obscuribacterales bacterium]|nr:FAD-dependent oxidoreductase [Candidatus Obscuribacterales bacterium]
MSQRIIIVGGGFAGVKCARTLTKLLPRDTELILFNQENHMVFHPLLAEVVSAAVQPKDVGAPLRQLLKDVRCRTEDVTGIDLDKKQVFYEAYDGQIRSMNFDHCVLTCGNTVNLSLVPGMDEHAFPLKTIGDALALQSHLMEQMEKAEVCEDPSRRAWYLSFVIVGAGFSGVEVAGEINDLVRSSRKFFRNIKEDEIKVTVVHSGAQILPEVSSNLRDFAKQKMEQAGVSFRLNSRATMATHEGLRIEDGSVVHGGTVVCTIGTTTQHLIAGLNIPKERGRLLTEPDMSLPGHPDIWALGDCGAVVNSLDGQYCPPVAQFAERQGAQAAHNIARRLSGEKTHPFRYKTQGQLCSIGGHSAVAEIQGLRISGFIAWFLWRGIYLMKLPSLTQQIKVGIEWMCDLIFARTLAHLKADRTKRLGKAHYGAGDFVFKCGDSATDFYVIERGEVEILRHRADGSLQCEAVLGAGDFFGESSLLDSTCRSHSVRAKTELVCMVLGRNVFTQISSALIPVRDAIAKASLKRTGMWHNVPDVRAILESMTIESMMESLPMPPIPMDSCVEEVIIKMNQTGADLCCIVDNVGELAGIITRSDLVRALEKAPLADPDVDLPVTDIMVMNPISLAINEPLAVAVSSMRDRDLKQIPIVDTSKLKRPIGRVRIEKIIEYVLTEMTSRRHSKAEAATTSEVQV